MDTHFSGHSKKFHSDGFIPCLMLQPAWTGGAQSTEPFPGMLVSPSNKGSKVRWSNHMLTCHCFSAKLLSRKMTLQNRSPVGEELKRDLPELYLKSESSTS